MNWKENWYAWVALALFAILVLWSVFSDSLVGPSPALTEWTTWAAKYVALAIAAQKVWKISDAMAARISR